MVNGIVQGPLWSIVALCAVMYSDCDLQFNTGAGLKTALEQTWQ